MNAKWKYGLKELFTFSKKERIGFVLLLCIILFVVLYPLIDFGSEESQRPTFEEFVEQIDGLEVKPDTGSVVMLFFFDPNTADSLTFLELGFSPNQIKSILAYRSTGAWFSVPDDFSMVYVVSDEQFQRVKPYIRIKQPKKPFRKVELNTADTTELQRLRGIGPYYARQVVRYREHLGGFYSAEQLKEIKGIDDERFSLFAEQYTLNIKHIKPLNINIADERTLKSHPYIGSECAKKIVEYRQKITIASIEQLVRESILSTQQAKKLSPYVFFN
ncbi:MAG: helix-hairpin-helix domain-containing protein [Prevotellaceae bacterium]|jgi:competence ComEA-like helix-hairpin-helix protein|nr:helix-hairpin-helix domain-containing protein [Prevotellaceae bacterium]